MIFAVSETKEKNLKKKMDKLEVYEKDLQEKFIRSGGKGGQNVNKTSTCVYLKHIPTGIEVKCQRERSQALNRFIDLFGDDFVDRDVKENVIRDVIKEVEYLKKSNSKPVSSKDIDKLCGL